MASIEEIDSEINRLRSLWLYPEESPYDPNALLKGIQKKLALAGIASPNFEFPFPLGSNPLSAALELVENPQGLKDAWCRYRRALDLLSSAIPPVISADPKLHGVQPGRSDGEKQTRKESGQDREAVFPKPEGHLIDSAKTIGDISSYDLDDSLVPPKRYGAGEDGLRRDRKIYQLAKAKFTNAEIAKKIEELAPKENWVSIGASYVPNRLKAYYLFTDSPILVRPGGRPRSKKTPATRKLSKHSAPS